MVTHWEFLSQERPLVCRSKTDLLNDTRSACLLFLGLAYHSCAICGLSQKLPMGLEPAHSFHWLTLMSLDGFPCSSCVCPFLGAYSLYRAFDWLACILPLLTFRELHFSFLWGYFYFPALSHMCFSSAKSQPPAPFCSLPCVLLLWSSLCQIPPCSMLLSTLYADFHLLYPFSPNFIFISSHSHYLLFLPNRFSIVFLPLVVLLIFLIVMFFTFLKGPSSSHLLLGCSACTKALEHN